MAKDRDPEEVQRHFELALYGLGYRWSRLADAALELDAEKLMARDEPSLCLLDELGDLFGGDQPDFYDSREGHAVACLLNLLHTIVQRCGEREDSLVGTAGWPQAQWPSGKGKK
jgi:hypothetical protein